MASSPHMRDGNMPSCPTTNTSARQPKSTILPSGSPVPEKSALPKATTIPAVRHRTLLPKWYMELDPPRPLSAINDDPVFNTRAAAQILGVSGEVMKKWRQRKQGPPYYQYDEGGPVRYALRALMKFRADHLVYPGDNK